MGEQNIILEPALVHVAWGVAHGWLPWLRNLSLSVVASAVLFLTFGLLFEAGPATAVGNSQLQSLIIHDPIPSGQPESASALNSFVTLMLITEGIPPPGHGTSFATLGWTYGPSTANSGLQVYLISFSIPGKSETYLDHYAAFGARDSASVICPYVRGPMQHHDLVQRIPGVGNGFYFECDRVNGIALNGATLARGHDFAILLTSTKAFSKSSIQAIARRQYMSLPTDR